MTGMITSAKIKKRARLLRQEMTPAEALLWEKLRNWQLAGYKFRRQKPIGRFIADFYCAECRLVVEVDGDIHDLNSTEDEARTQQFNDYVYHIIRFRNEQVTQRIESVLAAILANCQERYPSSKRGQR